MAEPNNNVSNKVKSYQSNEYAPELLVPETEVPKTSVPETTVPETEVPEINQIESITNVPVTNVPVTNVQQANVLNQTNTFNNSPKEEDIEGENQEPYRSPVELPDEIPPSFKNNTNGVSSTGVSSTGVSQGVSQAQGETVYMEKEDRKSVV